MTRALLLAVLLAGSACGMDQRVRPSIPPVRTVQVNLPGEVVTLESVIVPGYVTVVDFWAAHCAPCIPAAAHLAIQTASSPGILIRKIDVGDGFSPVAQLHNITALPQFLLYDRHRRLRHVLVGSDCLAAGALAKQLLAEP